MKKRYGSLVIGFVFIAVVLSACMYPDGPQGERQVVPAEAVAQVQVAVDNFQSARGVLPIRNFDRDTPMYERYVIDWIALQEGRFLSEIPGAAFEKGGNYYFVLVDVEHNPTVKLMDLVTIQTVGQIENSVKEYKQSHGIWPVGEEVNDGWHQLDYDALDMDHSPVRSVFSGSFVPVLLHESGRVAVDYAIDIMTVIRQEGIDDLDPQSDLREQLVEHSYFVPVRSAPYYWKGDRPVIAAPSA